MLGVIGIWHAMLLVHLAVKESRNNSINVSMDETLELIEVGIMGWLNAKVPGFDHSFCNWCKIPMDGLL